MEVKNSEVKRTFIGTYKWGDIKRHKLIDSMKSQGYTAKYKWEPQLIGEPLIIIWEK